MRYDVVTAQSVRVLIEQVNTMLALGWRLSGGVTYGDQKGLGYSLWAQAIYYEDA